MDLQPIKNAVAARFLLNHPFYRAWSEGTLPRENLLTYAQQYYHHVLAFPRYVSAVHSRCTVSEGRQALLENLIEEERGAENHPELWLRFCDALGLDRAQVKASEPAPATRALIETFFGLTGRSWEEGLGALYAYESQVPEVAKAKIEGLKQFYGVTSERGLSFFAVHQQADVHHRQAEEALFQDRVPAGSEGKVLASTQTAAEALWRFLDSVTPAMPAAQA